MCQNTFSSTINHNSSLLLPSSIKPRGNTNRNRVRSSSKQQLVSLSLNPLEKPAVENVRGDFDLLSKEGERGFFFSPIETFRVFMTVREKLSEWDIFWPSQGEVCSTMGGIISLCCFHVIPCDHLIWGPFKHQAQGKRSSKHVQKRNKCMFFT